MKTSHKILTASTALATIMGGGLLLSNNTYAATVGLTQADFTFTDAACTSHEANAKGISCYDVSGDHYYQISAGDYQLDENIDFGTGVAFTAGESFSLDLNGKTLSGSNTTVIELDSTNNTISGSGAITNPVSGVSFTARGVYTGGNLTSRNNLTVTGGTFGSVGMYGVNATITGGTYTGSGWSMAAEFSETNAVINGGTFSAPAASAAYFNQGADSTLEINGGSFTSEADNGIEFMEGVKNLKITAGTFTGKVSGLAFDVAPTAATLSGGTYVATGTGEYDYGGIVIYGADDISVLSGLLASGASYSDPSAERGGTDPNFFVYLKNKRVTISNGSRVFPEAAEEDTEETTSGSSAKSPNAGFTSAEANAATSVIATAIAATALTAAGLGIKKSLKKEA